MHGFNENAYALFVYKFGHWDSINTIDQSDIIRPQLALVVPVVAISLLLALMVEMTGIRLHISLAGLVLMILGQLSTRLVASCVGTPSPTNP
jgi:hypothetical protein